MVDNNPQVEINKPDYSRFDLSRIHKTSFDFGKLIPLANIQTLPGDNIEIDIDSFVRGMPTLAPIMDKVDLKVNVFYVPNRILYGGFEEFISDTEKISLENSSDYKSIPSFDVKDLNSLGRSFFDNNPKNDIAYSKGHKDKYPFTRLLDYLGARPSRRVKQMEDSQGNKVNHLQRLVFDRSVRMSLLPILAYNKIYMDYYIPQRWLKYYRDNKILNTFTVLDGLLYDYRKSMVSSSIEVIPDEAILLEFLKKNSKNSSNISDYLDSDFGKMFIKGLYGTPDFSIENQDFTKFKNVYKYFSLFSIKDVFWNHDYFTNALPLPNMTEDVKISGFNNLSKSVLDSIAGQSANEKAESMRIIMSDKNYYNTVKDLRNSIATQQYLEKINIAGGRYQETLKVLWNEDVDTDLLNMSEYIGGDVISMFVNEVEQTSQISENSNLGDLAGKPITAGKTQKFYVNAKEHGQIMVLAHLVPKRSYSSRIDRSFMQLNLDDFPNPSFENIGDEAVHIYELGNIDDVSVRLNTNPMTVFGYVPRYSSYKIAVDEFSGEMRHNYLHWHLGDTSHSISPKISPKFMKVKVREDIFRVPSVEDKFLGTFSVNVYANRKLSSNPQVGLSRV